MNHWYYRRHLYAYFLEYPKLFPGLMSCYIHWCLPRILEQVMSVHTGWTCTLMEEECLSYVLVVKNR